MYMKSWSAILADLIRAITVDNMYGIPLVNKKPGLMKDKNNGAIMTEFDTKKVKSVKNNVVAKSITFNDYTRCLFDEIKMTHKQSYIKSKLHEVYTISETKIALSPYDDERYCARFYRHAAMRAL